MIDTLTTKFRLHIIVIALFLFVLPLFIQSFTVSQPIKYLGIGILSLLFFPIGWLMGSAVLGFQVKNPFTTAKHMDSICKSAFYFFYFGGVLLLLLSMLNPSTEQIPLNMLPGGFGIAYAAYKIRKKHVLEQPKLVAS